MCWVVVWHHFIRKNLHTVCVKPAATVRSDYLFNIFLKDRMTNTVKHHSHELQLAVCVYDQQVAPKYAHSRQHLKWRYTGEEQKKPGDCEKVSQKKKGGQIRYTRRVGFQDKLLKRITLPANLAVFHWEPSYRVFWFHSELILSFSHFLTLS